MAHPYKRPVSLRATPLAIVGESAAIVTDTVRGRVSALLAESPADPTQPGTPMTVTVGGAGRSRVTGAPAAGQFAVSTVVVTGASGSPKTIWQPLLVFHSSDAGATASVSYHGIGTLLTPELEEAREAIRAPLVGVASTAALPTPSTDMADPGWPGRTAYLSDDSQYYSTGTEWRRVSGPVGGTVHTAQQTDSGAGTDARTTAQAHAEPDTDTGIGTDSSTTTHTPAAGSHVEDRTDSAAGDAASVTQVTRVVSGQDAGVGSDAATATLTPGGGGGSSITSTFEADANGWTPSGGFSRSSSSPVAGSWSMRDANTDNLADNTAAPTLTRTVSGNRNAITSVVVKARGSFSGYTGFGEHMDVQVTDGTTVRATAALTTDGTTKTITLTPSGMPASGGTLVVRVLVTGGDEGGIETGPSLDYDIALDDITINGIAS